MKSGKLYGVGIGPGDPELLTLKAKRILEEVPVLFVPKSQEGKRSLALSIVEDFIHEDIEIKEIFLPMIKDSEELERYWREAAKSMFATLEEEKDAVFITLGDVGMYSTFTYVLRFLRQIKPDIVVEMVPGVSSINATASWAQEPLAEGGESIAVTTALKPDAELGDTIGSFDNIVVMKAGKYTGKVAGILEDNNFSGDVIFTSRIGFEDAYISRNLQEIKGKDFDYLSTFVIKNNFGGRKK